MLVGSKRAAERQPPFTLVGNPSSLAAGASAVATAAEKYEQNDDPFAAGAVAVAAKEVTKSAASARGFAGASATAVVQEVEDQDDPDPVSTAAASSVIALTSTLGS